MRGAPVRLRCEYLECPIGIATARPRLSWWPNDPRPAELQTGYQIQAATTPALLRSGGPDLWDSAHQAGQQTQNVEYAGAALQSGSRVWWRVRCYDSDGVASPWSEPASFEVGLLTPRDWQACWIASPLVGTPTTSVPVPLLWRDFDLAQPPAAARLYVAALGAALCEVNGEPAGGDEPVAPSIWPGKRVPFRTYDVTSLLCSGSNRLGVLLGDGTYCGHSGGGPRQQSGERPALCAQLVVETGSGERHVIGTDGRWRWRPSWVLRGDRDGGEEIDGRQQAPGWSRPAATMDGYPVELLADAEVERTAHCVPGARVLRQRPAVERRHQRLADGLVRVRWDFGGTLLGRVRARLRAPAGTSLIVRYGDAVPSHGATAERWEEAADRYTASGYGIEVFEPRFAVHAFRWVEITSILEPHAFDEMLALEIGVPVAATADLRCDHRLLERLFEVAVHTCRMGLALGPVAGMWARDRSAAAADAEAILAGAGSALEVCALFGDWARALQPPPAGDGAPPGRAAGPQIGAAGRAVAEAAAEAAAEAGLAESLLSVLWHLYRCYGDRRLLEQSYGNVQRHLRHRAGRCAGLLSGAVGGRLLTLQVREALWYGYELSLASRMAGVLGRLSDLEEYEALGGRLRLAFRARFVTRAGLLAVDDQQSYLLALELGLFDDLERDTALGCLESQLCDHGFRPGVDLRHGALLLEVLTLEGRPDLAYRTLLQTSGPSWLGTLDAGASVLWDAVQDHGGRMALACIAGWLQRFLLGLELDADLTPELNAYRRMRIQPRPPLGAEFPAGPPIRHASGHLDTVHGRYECAWNITPEGFRLRVRVPANCSARVILPDGFESLVVAGEHEFHMRLGPLDLPAPPAPQAGVPVLRSISGGT